MSACDLGPGPSSLVARSQEERLLLEALRQIPVDYQIVLELHYWEQQTAAEIAEILGIPLGSVKTRLLRGKERLRERIEQLASSGELLASTLGDLDGWASCVRDRLRALRAGEQPVSSR